MAIARDTNAQFTGSGSAYTNSYTVTGSNTLLLVAVEPPTTQVPTSVTYNGTGMTLVKTQAIGGSNQISLYSLFGATSGAHNLVVNFTSSIAWNVTVASYNGVLQTGFNATNLTSGTGSPATKSITPTVANCWVVLYAANADANWAAGTGANGLGSASSIQFFDSNGTVTSGSAYSMTLTYAGTRLYAWEQVTIAPVVTVVPGSGLFYAAAAQ